MKIAAYSITLSEWPTEISLYIEISGCPNHCQGCHSKHLAEDIGEPITEELLASLIGMNDGITAVVLGGGDQNPKEVSDIAKFIKETFKDMKVCWYSGRESIPYDMIDLANFDAIKIGPYIERLGGLASPETNQKFYLVEKNCEDDCNKETVFSLIDKTCMFTKQNISFHFV